MQPRALSGVGLGGVLPVRTSSSGSFCTLGDFLQGCVLLPLFELVQVCDLKDIFSESIWGW